MIKKLLFILFCFVAFASCSEDDATEKPILITPDTNGYEFNIGDKGEYTLKIYSRSGNQIFEKSFTGSTFTWNGKSDNDHTLADGLYLYTICNSDKTVNQTGHFYIYTPVIEDDGEEDGGE